MLESTMSASEQFETSMTSPYRMCKWFPTTDNVLLYERCPGFDKTVPTLDDLWFCEWSDPLRTELGESLEQS